MDQVRKIDSCNIYIIRLFGLLLKHVCIFFFTILAASIALT
jgi:hypothetical protein